MTRYRVTLYTEQRATLEVEAPEGADDRELTEAALMKLDESGGAEWETTFAYLEGKEECS